MPEIDLKSMNHVHFIGVGGVSMSGLAETLAAGGCRVTGSDATPSEFTARLERAGVSVDIGQRGENIRRGTQLVVYSAAVKPDNPELLAAKAAGVPVIDRARLMGMLLDGYARPVCVAGTHGKTSTTAMLAQILLGAGRDPAINLGGVLPALGGNYRVGHGDIFLAEACEYYDSFLQFFPHIGVILNIEADHLDYFRDLSHIQASFRRFAANIRPGGTLIINERCADVITPGYGGGTVWSYGIERGDFSARGLLYDESGFGRYRLYKAGEYLTDIRLSVRGEHNVENSVAAAATAICLGVEPGLIAAGLAVFGGANRRFEHKGRLNGVDIVDDYAHHPTEIRATLKTAARGPWRRVFVVFQPHTYSRTIRLKDDIVAAFDDVYHVCLLDIFAARETDTGRINSRDLLAPLRERGVRADYFASFEDVEKFLLEHCIQGDLLITMGAGDVYLLGEQMLRTGLYPLST